MCENLEITLGSMSEQIKHLEGSIINIDGKQLKIKMFGVFDLCALNVIIGKQNHSATFLCLDKLHNISFAKWGGNSPYLWGGISHLGYNFPLPRGGISHYIECPVIHW